MQRLISSTLVVGILSVVTYATEVHAQAEASTTWAYCFSTDPRQCSVAGRYYLEGTGGAQVTPSWAQLAWQHGCESEDGESCRELGVLYDQGRIVAQSSERAYSLFGRGCQLGSMNSCHEQARMLRLGRGVQNDLSEANRLDTWACDYGSASACLRMANVFAQGQGVPRNDVESRRLLSEACRLGDADACLGSLGATAAEPSGQLPTNRDSAAGVAAPPHANQRAQSASPTGQTVTVPVPPPGYGSGQAAEQQLQGPVMHPQVVLNAVNGVMPQMSRCYERRARRVPITGAVTVQWRVGPNGRPVGLEVSPQLSTIGDRWMQRCVKNAANRMHFDPPPARISEQLTRSFSFNQ